MAIRPVFPPLQAGEPENGARDFATATVQRPLRSLPWPASLMPPHAANWCKPP